MIQIRRIKVTKELRETLERFKELNEREPVVMVARATLMGALMVIEQQDQKIKALDQRLAGLMDRLPEELLKEVTAEWVKEMEGADDEA